MMAYIKTRWGGGTLRLYSALVALTVCAFTFLSFPIFAKATTEPTSVTAGAFTITGDNPTEGTDYTYTGTSGVDGYLCIISEKELTIKNTNPEPTSDYIVVSLSSGLDEAHLILAGVNIETTIGAISPFAFCGSPTTKTDPVDFNATITLKEKTDNLLQNTATVGDAAGLFWNNTANNKQLVIQGKGSLTAKTGGSGAGIGGQAGYSGIGITILDGSIVATSGGKGAGIGGGGDFGARDIKINGGTVFASSQDGAGIGGGSYSSFFPDVPDVSNITILGGVIHAKGGVFSAGIGAPMGATASNNSISGNVTVLACAGQNGGKPALEGFTTTSGIIYTGTVEYTAAHPDGVEHWNSGSMIGTDVTIQDDVTFPLDLTINSDQTVRVAEGVTLSAEDGVALDIQGTLENSGIITIPSDNLSCSGNGKVTTKVSYDTRGGTFVPVSNDTLPSDLRTYKDANSSDILTYGTLPTATKEGKTFDGWYLEQDGHDTSVSDTSAVLLNEHMFYASYSDAPTPEPSPSNTGWSQDDTGWQYRDESGNLTHGWLNLDGTWYYFDDAGYAVHDMWLWNEDFGPHWYYFWNNCSMATNAWLWDGAWYWVCSTGPMIQGLWQWIDNAWYGFWWNGRMCTGWVWDNAYVAWFYCYDNGVVARNAWVDGYYLSDSGICLL